MHPDDVFCRIGNVPYMRPREARLLYDFILHNQLRVGLELGFLHGVSSAYLGGAVAELEGGCLTSIDLKNASQRNPNIDDVLRETGLADIVSVFYEPKSFNWRLMRFLAEGRHGSFSFCFLDGGHTWDTTGLAFCVTEKLLAPGGWAIFDDLYFTFRQSSNHDQPWVRRMPEDEQVEPQVRYVFELLVEPSEHFANFRRIQGRFGFAQKKVAGTAYLPKELDIAVSRALERAHLDPEYREQLLLEPQDALRTFLPAGTAPSEPVRFEQSGGSFPHPAHKGSDGVFVVPMEQSAWANNLSRARYEGLLASNRSFSVCSDR